MQLSEKASVRKLQMKSFDQTLQGSQFENLKLMLVKMGIKNLKITTRTGSVLVQRVDFFKF